MWRWLIGPDIDGCDFGGLIASDQRPLSDVHGGCAYPNRHRPRFTVCLCVMDSVLTDYNVKGILGFCAFELWMPGIKELRWEKEATMKSNTRILQLKVSLDGKAEESIVGINGFVAEFEHYGAGILAF
ncbi:hypothetical protein QVD17_12909 [Tagetes erecta]|uniref:Uncharacterized protein n=1 Tax=Tagetes erecta TaxID=13708 RepID=A0AAD8P346_TARER|nr:hypothetical protein QVD17_12909 [Tagetes erecta]